MSPNVTCREDEWEDRKPLGHGLGGILELCPFLAFSSVPATYAEQAQRSTVIAAPHRPKARRWSDHRSRS